MTGTRLGHYRILEKLGEGGMGEVYRAHDEQLDRDVAIKVLPDATVSDRTARARLQREAKAAAKLKHPSICTIHEVGDADGRSYIAMELVEGRPLSDLVRGTPLPLDQTLRVAHQIADALAHAHARQIVHRDLKCANVIVTEDGHVKVLDFGLAKRLGGLEPGDGTTREAPPTLTEAGSLVGTLAYMAPEQIRGEPADARSDLWALGVVLYEVCAGRRPFAGKSSGELIARILSEPPSALPSGVPVSVRALIDRCLEKEPARRPQTAGEVRTAVETIQSGATAPWTWRYRMARRPRLWLGAAVVLIAIVAALVRFGLPGVTGVAPRIDSLAVLPLENLSGDAAQEYFADGMTEVLSTDLARLSGLARVTARGSVVRYKGTDTPLADIARELDVDALVTGSVMRSGKRVSITAQLLDPATGDQLWTNRYDRDLEDVLTLRNEIVAAIVREIRAELLPAAQAAFASAGPVNAEAFEAALKGRFHWLRQTREDYDLAEQYYQLALEKDPGYAVAYAGLGSVWMMRGDAGFQPASETNPKANALMARALELDDTLAEVHVAVGNQKAVVWDWAGAEQAYQRAVDLNPNLADAQFFHSALQIVLGRRDVADRAMERALSLDPLNEFIKSFYGWHLNFLGRYDEAIPVFQGLLPTGPNRASNYLGLWGAYHRKGMYEQALSSAREYFTAAGDGEFSGMLDSAPDAAAYRAAMRRAGEAMIAATARRHVPAVRIARMFAHAGDAERALEWLERAYDNHESALMRLGVAWDWLDLHPQPRFQALMRRLALPL
jgi:TolB-like protein/Tfp pilus assembly protein PilF